ncbi:polyketide cyclase [Blastococcus sp. TF02-09]|uniref:SRPBCC family protein n=1 Tax=Blastococcus sp. TF02-09 TaxID=2250576 RepID=UPI000E12FBB0|nr:SRPBCC family protein [Blastococcus sp. TF02-9]RBY81431.1 polyketide cyclase [Blastococcus sp. TF02-9]
MTGAGEQVPGYLFRDEWHVAAVPAEVWAAVRRVEEWPAWWPSVENVTRAGADDAGSEVWTFVFRTRLPYRMAFDATVVQDEPLRGVRTTVSGRVEGEGRWEVAAVAGGAAVRFDWRVRPRPAWMRLLSPLARPVFVWNHAALMREGGEGLAARLGTRLLAPPVTAPAVAPALVVAAAWPAALLALHRTLRGRSRVSGRPRSPLRRPRRAPRPGRRRR